MDPVCADSPLPSAPAAAMKELGIAPHKSCSLTTSRLPKLAISHPRQHWFYNILLPGASDVAVKSETTHRDGSFVESRASPNPFPRPRT